MEPFHQLSVPMASVPDLDAALATIGFSTEHTDERMLVHRIAGFHTLVCRRRDESAAYSLGTPDSVPDTYVMVYLNVPDATQAEIRTHLESLGATWSYTRF
ncbi:hypothetical protein FHS27_006388 [Rhodopirellula rubra]|uniref:Uncharacterized protein n=1 Tax=Aporhodopirellula rubra TaxID=980271 RepID=A0A7W5E5F2_9BACT|nr:hypothetical protein [Aporhodopirellula rubra]MBB3210541.1 hypothetical protein [Aporhodopirellula rubra]